MDKFGDISALMNANVPEVNRASHSKVLNALAQKPVSSSSFFNSFGINRTALSGNFVPGTGIESNVSLVHCPLEGPASHH
jgi:hypothetical protein